MRNLRPVTSIVLMLIFGSVACLVSSCAKQQPAWTCSAPFELGEIGTLKGDLLYGTDDSTGEMLVCDTKTGKILWQRRIGDKFFSRTPVFRDQAGLICTVGHPDGNSNTSSKHLLAFDDRTGKLAWSMPVLKEPGRFHYKFNDGWLFAWEDYQPKTITAVDLTTRKLVWRCQLPLTNAEKPDIDDIVAGPKAVAVALTQGPQKKLLLLQRNNGQILHSEQIGEIGAELSSTGSVIFLNDANLHVVKAIDLAAGKVAWQYVGQGTDKVMVACPTGNETTKTVLVSVSTGSNLTRADFHALDPKSGRVLWSVPMEELGDFRYCRQFDNEALVVDTGKQLVALDQRTGEVRWREPAADFIPSSYTNLVLAMTEDNSFETFTITVIEPRGGKVITKLRNPAGVTEANQASIISDGKRLYLLKGTNDLVAMDIPQH